MNRWFQKGNARRFYRIDMPVKTFVTPASPIRDREIYASGLDYFPPTLRRYIENEKNETLYWVNKVQDQKVVVTKMFKEVIDYIEFFGDATQMMAKGLNPAKDPQYLFRLQSDIEGFSAIEELLPSSPKTYRYFKMLEEKFLAYLKSMFNSARHSKPDYFEANRHLPLGYKIDETLEMLTSKSNFDKIPLIQAIVHLVQFVNAHLNAYRQLNDDNILRHYPDEWPRMKVNISASGIAIRYKKRFTQFEKVDVFLYFPDQDKVLEFEGTVVDTRSIDSHHEERVAINFDFPNGQKQDFLQNQIQRYEIEECMDFQL
ncbi:PilZ domain-containing protein [Hydrogenovibrio halophilus]|uniref:PilZ domain-containing protein n=1 Tax=Hydrogenovibrio halophilus TaxID=373391 RepID=UPI0003732F28|nr:PilZ domain-containing protein [Hydrogenovibrio halophilus]